MAWDYKALEESIYDGVGVWVPVGLKIYKTLFDDSGLEIITVETTADDALQNAGENFFSEYYLAVKELFSRQLDEIFSKGDEGTINFSLANIYGRKLEQALAVAKYLKEGIPNGNVPE